MMWENSWNDSFPSLSLSQSSNVYKSYFYVETSHRTLFKSSKVTKPFFSRSKRKYISLNLATQDFGSILFLCSYCCLFALIFLSRLKLVLYYSLHVSINFKCCLVRSGYSFRTSSSNVTFPFCFRSKKL